jgi:hypothetical protein
LVGEPRPRGSKMRCSSPSIRRNSCRPFDFHASAVTASLLAALVSAVLSFVACGGSHNNTGPSTVNADVTGRWQGTGSSASGLTTTFGLVLNQSGTNVSGTFSCLSFACISPTGTVNATVSGNNVRGTVSFPTGGGCNTFNGTVSGNQMTGSYSCQAALSSDQGTFS